MICISFGHSQKELGTGSKGVDVHIKCLFGLVKLNAQTEVQLYRVRFPQDNAEAAAGITSWIGRQHGLMLTLHIQ